MKGPCASNPCQNNGKCSNHGPNYYCDCPSGYGGNNCEICNVLFQIIFLFLKFINPVQIAPCSLEPCRNGGQCRNSGSKYLCMCPRGYSGLNCETSKHYFFNIAYRKIKF